MPSTAIFDLDRTITRSPTWTPFLFYVHGLSPVFLFRFLLLALYMIGYKLKLISRDSVKKYGLQTLTTLDKETLKNKAEAFVASRIANGLRPGAVEAITFHRRRGDRLILATAAVDMVANPLGLALGFDEVIATRLNWNTNTNALSPSLEGTNCYGLEKLRRVEERRALRPFDEPVYAYSDHVSDLELLRNADHGIAVNPSAALRRAAHKYGIKIVDFDVAPYSTQTLEKNK